MSLPKVSQVYRSLAEARQYLEQRELSQQKRAKVMRGVLTRVLESEQDINVVNTIDELLM